MMANKELTIAQETLEAILRSMGIDAAVNIASEEPPMLAVRMSQPGLLIGVKGEGIRALQHVLRVTMVRQGHELPVVIDIDGYRQKKEEQLREMAKRKADQVQTSGRPAELSPMSSYERRVVHTTVAELDGVETESLGDGADRRVLIKKA